MLNDKSTLIPNQTSASPATSFTSKSVTAMHPQLFAPSGESHQNTTTDIKEQETSFDKTKEVENNKQYESR